MGSKAECEERGSINRSISWLSGVNGSPSGLGWHSHVYNLGHGVNPHGGRGGGGEDSQRDYDKGNGQ